MNVNIDQLRPSVVGRLIHVAGAVAICLAAAAYVSCVNHPFEANLQRQENRITSLKTKYSKRDSLNSEKCDLTIEIETIESNLKRWQQRIPASANVDQFLNEVGQLAKKHQVTILDFRPGQSQLENEFSRLDIQLNATGSYRKYCQFLESLEQADRLNQIRNFSVNAMGDVCQFSMTVSIFHRQSSTDTLLTSVSRPSGVSQNE